MVDRLRTGYFFVDLLYNTIQYNTTAASVPAPQTVLSVIVPRVLSCTFHVGTVKADTLYGTIQNMKPSSFLGLDGISVDMFRRFYNGEGYILFDIVNSCLEY